jgi:hypothetical protein
LNIGSAARVLPLTHASTTSTPRFAATAFIACAVDGRIVLWIAITRPGFAPASRPFSPSITARTCASVCTQIPTTSLAAATWSGLAAAFAPPATRAATGAAAMSNAVVASPAAGSRSAIGLPMYPSPTKPVLMSRS